MSLEPSLGISDFVGKLDPTPRTDAWFLTKNIDLNDLEEMGQIPMENVLYDREVWGDRGALISKWQSDVEMLRKALRQVKTRQELYACVDFSAQIDDAMNQDPTWERPFDSYTMIENGHCNEWQAAELAIQYLEQQTANFAAEKARLDNYARSVHVMSFKPKEVVTT